MQHRYDLTDFGDSDQHYMPSISALASISHQWKGDRDAILQSESMNLWLGAARKLTFAENAWEEGKQTAEHQTRH
jgi:hypothetical protein